MEGDNETRYKYLYSKDEIDELAKKVENTSEHTIILFAQFNNHWRGYAPRNAVDMKKALKLPFVELPIQNTIEDVEED